MNVLSFPRMGPSIARLAVLGLCGCLFTNTLMANTPGRKSKKRPQKFVEQEAEPTPTPVSTGSKEASTDEPTPTPKPSAQPRKSLAAPNASIQPESLVEFSGELARVKKLIVFALGLTSQNLTYTYSSDDPANGGMDCSGFNAYVLRNNGSKKSPGMPAANMFG